MAKGLKSLMSFGLMLYLVPEPKFPFSGGRGLGRELKVFFQPLFRPYIRQR
jgi:hypothetical protein